MKPTSLVVLVSFLIATVGTTSRADDHLQPTIYPGTMWVETPRTGWQLASNFKGRSSRRYASGKTVFDVEYSTDSFGRREVPSSNVNAKKFLAVFGCSYVFGEGLSADQTLAETIAKKNLDWSVYNYGNPGWGTHSVLAKLESTDLKAQIAAPSGLILYFFYPFHLDRTVGEAQYVKWGGDKGPYYEIGDDGFAEFKGSFAVARPWTTRLYKFLDTLGLLEAFPTRRFPAPNRSSVQLTTAILRSASRLVEKTWNGSVKFKVVVLSAQDAQTSLTDELIDELKASKVDYVDLRSLNLYEDGNLIEGDLHPNGRYNEILAEHVQPLITEFAPATPIK